MRQLANEADERLRGLLEDLGTHPDVIDKLDERYGLDAVSDFIETRDLDEVLPRGVTIGPVWFEWIDILRRCYDPAHSLYLQEGARGVKVAPQWQGRKGYATFKADLAGPSG